MDELEPTASDQKRINSKIVGSSGEFLVCGVLAQFRWAAAMTRDGIPMTDVLAEHAETGRSISVQVKTNWVAKGEAKWQFGEKDVVPAKSQTQWYVLVKLEGSEAPATPSFYVVPKDHLAAGVWITHQGWLTDPAAAPGKRNTGLNNSRASEFVFAGYKDRWDLLFSDAGGAPVLLPRDHRALCLESRVGLPPRHPWLTTFPHW